MSDPFAVPELTRGLRSFAAPNELGGMHDRFFAPLLDARRAAQLATRWASRVTAFDAERLEATLRATLRTFADERFARSAPDKRALAAQLEDACGEMFDAFRELGVTALSVSGAKDDVARAALWSAWVTSLHQVFHAADRGWEHARPLLGVQPVLGGRRPARQRRPRRER